MDNFFQYFYQDIGRVFQSLIDLFSAFGNFLNYLLNFPMRMDKIKENSDGFGVWEWILLFVVNLILLALIVLMVIGIVKLCKKYLRFGVSPKKYDEVVKQVRTLQRDLIRANYEKDRLLAMRVAELSGEQLPNLDGEEQNEEDVSDNAREIRAHFSFIYC